MLRFAKESRSWKFGARGKGGPVSPASWREWFDLTLPTFDPVFSFPVQGQCSDAGRSTSACELMHRIAGQKQRCGGHQSGIDGSVLI